MTLSAHEIYKDLRATGIDHAHAMRAAREELSKRREKAKQAPEPEPKRAWKRRAR